MGRSTATRNQPGATKPWLGGAGEKSCSKRCQSSLWRWKCHFPGCAQQHLIWSLSHSRRIVHSARRTSHTNQRAWSNFMDYSILNLTSGGIECPCGTAAQGKWFYKCYPHPGRIQRLGRGRISGGKWKMNAIIWGTDLFVNHTSVVK